jgi:thiol:disulfide interchange protein DsbD
MIKNQSGDAELRWEPFSPERLSAYRAAGKPVLLDFTAEWCVSCKVNERLVLRTKEVQNHIRELGVVPMKADWTNHDAGITQALAEFGRSGIPFYVLYGRTPNAAGIELPTVLTTSSVLHALATLSGSAPEKPAIDNP